MKTFKTALNIWKEDHNTMEIMVEGSRVASVAGMLHEREIPFSVAVGDLDTLLEKERGAATSKLVKPCHEGYSKLNKKVKQLKMKHNRICSSLIIH